MCRALQQREPIPWTKSKLVVPTEAVAVGIHIAIVRGAYGEAALRDAPFHAIRSGDYWVAHGTVPKGMAGGMIKILQEITICALVRRG